MHSSDIHSLHRSVEYELPFPSEYFDLVRLSNMTLGIPFNRWNHVLCEIRRVLTPGGRLELIDDEINFPYEDKIRKWGHASSRPTSTASETLTLPLTSTSSFGTDLDSDMPELTSSSRTSVCSWEKQLPPTPGCDSDDTFHTADEGSEYLDESIGGLSMQGLLHTIDKEIKRSRGNRVSVVVEEADDGESIFDEDADGAERATNIWYQPCSRDAELSVKPSVRCRGTAVRHGTGRSLPVRRLTRREI